MKVTPFGKKQLKSVELRQSFYNLAFTHLRIHGTPEDDFRDGLTSIAATYLAGTDQKHRFAMPPDIDNMEEFLADPKTRELIDPLVNEVIEMARGPRLS